MFGPILSLASAIAGGAEDIVHRHILIKEDAMGYAFLWQFFSAVLFLPFLLLSPMLPSVPYAWILVIIAAFLWCTITYTRFVAFTELEVSAYAP
ncbi:hypothetical protein HZC07_01570, partial [Candidatus Micrarchaeota archaeon]|nr:hypothetical protein [Candidatus Micrarchaeota archaeon]